MAETDGTPRFRKSKPPNSKGGRNAPNRNTRPNGKARKRAALNGTLPNGATLTQEPVEPAQAQNEDQTAVVVVAAKPEKSESDVVKTMPTVIRAAEPVAEVIAEPTADALQDTHAEPGSSGTRSRLQRGPNPATLRSKRPLLASTLRMELTVRRTEGSEPGISIRPSPSWNDSAQDISGVSDAADSDTTFKDGHDGASTQSESGPRARKPTVPGGFATFQDIPLRSDRSDEAAQSESAVLSETMRRGSDIGHDTQPNANTPRPRRPRRPGERTLIMTRRDIKQNSKRDWLFVVMLVAALGLTASMFLSRQAPADEVVDASAYDDPQDADGQGADPFATTLQPYKAKPAPRPAAAAPGAAITNSNANDKSAQPKQVESSISASIQATELRSLPAGAEVVAGDAVVGSTPVRVARGSTEMTYTLRMPGHQPKVVRVGPQSPASIMVELTRIVSGLPAATGFSHFGPVGLTGVTEPPADAPAPAAPAPN